MLGEGGFGHTSAFALIDEAATAKLELTPADIERMEGSAALLELALEKGKPVYGVTRGFGPLVAYAAGDSEDQGANLIHHLSVGQEPFLDPDITQVMLWLRLTGMRKGYSAVSPGAWQEIADLLNCGFTPAVPSRGSVSASGDLTPLAHAALAMSGTGEAWHMSGGMRRRAPASKVLDELGCKPIRWQARTALSFVNGTSASLALALSNHVSLLRLAWSVCALTGRAVTLLDASTEPYDRVVVRARGGSHGHATAAAWVTDQLPRPRHADAARAVQEPYSLRCAPQVVGSCLDYLWAAEELLLREAGGCTDNPVIGDGAILHAGNFHSINAGLASDLHSLIAHQLAFVAERQLALLLDPATNGGAPALLAPSPGATSGLAGVQIAATAMTAEIRQLATPATTTSLPTNLSNQDVVPMSLNGARRTNDQIRLAELVVGSLAMGVTQLAQARDSAVSAAIGSKELWAGLAKLSPRLTQDRPMAHDVREAASMLATAASGACRKLRPTGPAT